MKIQSLKSKYEKEVLPQLKEKFGYANNFEVPRIEKVTINVGIGRLEKEKDKIEELVGYIREITGQQPVKSKARKSIAGFKLREGTDVGIKVTLRGKKMWDFMDRLVNIAFPRTRDFQGIKNSSLGARGNLNIGMKEHIVFPEIHPERVKNIFGFQINISNTAKNREEGETLFKLLGFPIK